jgi:hypothetical protein
MQYLLKELKYGSEFEVQGQQTDVAEGDVLKDIKDERMVEVSNQQLKSESVKWDKKLDELWIVMPRHSRRKCNMKKEEINCFNSSAEEEVLGKCNSRLQHKVWKPGKSKLELKCNGSEGSGKLQYKVWKPGD